MREKNTYEVLIEKLNIENNDLRAQKYTMEYMLKYYEDILKRNNLDVFILKRGEQ